MSGGSARVVVFDIGNVLLRWNPRNLYRKMFPDPARMEWFLANVCDGPWNEAQDAGRPWAEAVAECCGRFPDWQSEIRAYDERWIEMLDGEISDNVRVLESLKGAGVPVFAITNFSTEKFDLARKRHAFLALFDGIVVSGHERLLKPDPRIFELFLTRYGFAGAECIFIDDSETNVRVASRLGMATIHFSETLDLRAALGALLPAWA
ncbi:MAG: HAD family phosphatase [Pseudomonadota bacterium]|nr:HAD family phosphatase [Pseudomonadota bacterium]